MLSLYTSPALCRNFKKQIYGHKRELQLSSLLSACTLKIWNGDSGIKSQPFDCTTNDELNKTKDR